MIFCLAFAFWIWPGFHRRVYLLKIGFQKRAQQNSNLSAKERLEATFPVSCLRAGVKKSHAAVLSQQIWVVFIQVTRFLDLATMESLSLYLGWFQVQISAKLLSIAPIWFYYHNLEEKLSLTKSKTKLRLN